MMVSGAAYLSAVSIMLASYGFFYGLYKERIQVGLEVGTTKADKAGYEKQVKQATTARRTAWLLGTVSLVVWLIFLGPVVEEIQAACAVDFALSHYSAVDVAFVGAATTWLVIAAMVFHQVLALRRTGQRLARETPGGRAGT